MQIVTNNLIVIGIFALVSIAALIYRFITYGLLETNVISRTFSEILFYAQFAIWPLVYFLLARAFLRFSGNFLFDIAAFSAIIIFSILFVASSRKFFSIFPEEMLDSPKKLLQGVWGLYITYPSLMLGDEADDIFNRYLGNLAYCTSVFVSLFVQYLGMASRGIRIV